MTVRFDNGFLKAAADEKGAELSSLAIKESGKELLWNGDPSFWARRSPILFPIVGRLRDDSYEVEGKKYFMSQHGFARDALFRVAEAGAAGARFVLSSEAGTEESYPFDFELAVTYCLTGSSLSMEAEVKNRGRGRMPFSLGFHPGFRCPLPEGGTLEDHAIFFEGPERCSRLFLEDGLIAGEEPFDIPGGALRLSERLFSRDALVLKGLLSKRVALGRLDGKGTRIEVRHFGLPFLGLWKKKDAPFVCIEPWQGTADRKDRNGNFFEKEGCVVLPPGRSFSAKLIITVS